ncbi:MAG: hypothetical protein WC342_07670 [Methanoregula sp.]|jgi:hypothetical protein
MDVKTQKNLLTFFFVLVILGLSFVIGDYAAGIASSSTPVKNASLCQIIFLTGCIAGMAVILALQEFERRNLPCEPDGATGRSGYSLAGDYRKD